MKLNKAVYTAWVVPGNNPCLKKINTPTANDKKWRVTNELTDGQLYQPKHELSYEDA